jgi:glucoamylase
MLVNFDSAYRIRDIYWPHVGSENHTAGHPFRFGVWIDGVFRWTDDPGWTIRLAYCADTLVTSARLEHHALPVAIVCEDVVDFHEALYLRRIAVRNRSERSLGVRLFFSHDFHIAGSDVGDTAYYEPERGALFHYKGTRWFMINAARPDAHGDLKLGLDGWATGVKESREREGTWRDAEDGELSGNPIAQGSVDSTAAIHLQTEPGKEARAWYWIAAGHSFDEVTSLNRSVRQKGPDTFIDRTRHWWTLWSTKESCPGLETLGASPAELYKRSLLVVATQIDAEGGITAANDFDITGFARDTYSYVWPRDGALVADSLSRAGYSLPPARFFDFCHRAITKEGYLLHKYNPDGSLASSWHAWVDDRGSKVLPVQEDETALVLWALWRHWERFRHLEALKPLYRGLVIRAANWLVEYRDPSTGLPEPSWDLWEERRGVHAWTCGATWAGLVAAARFAEIFGESSLSQRYRDTAEQMRAAAIARLWLPEEGRFVRSIAGGGEPDGTLDASLCGLWLFGMLPPDDPRVVATMDRVHEGLAVRTDVGGWARYEGDYYFRAIEDPSIPGNPWFVSTLWIAQWEIAVARDDAGLAAARDKIQWAVDRALPSGIMAEQVHPLSGDTLSVSPLTWSHAAYVATVHDYLEKKALLQAASASQGSPLSTRRTPSALRHNDLRPADFGAESASREEE